MQAEQTTTQARNAGLIQAFGSLGMLLTGAVLIYVINPLSTRIIPPCPFYWATDCYCPGCGAARSLHSLVRGDFGAAFGYNPLLMLSLPVLGYIYLSFLSGEFFGRSFPSFPRLWNYAWAIPVVIAVYWVARNLPWEPFTYLAP